MSSLMIAEPRHAPAHATASIRDPNAVALEVLAGNGFPEPMAGFVLEPGDALALAAATSTRLMDLYRLGRSSEVFDLLVEQSSPQMMRRVRTRLRFLGGHLDPQEVLQDTYINIYRYPTHFDGRRPGAFHAWSARIVDNAIRRQLRKQKSGIELRLLPDEVLARESDSPQRDPRAQVIAKESCQQAAEAMVVFLGVYLQAYAQLSERERFVLQMVEVHQMCYADLARVLEIRPEALKMVVFRARRRIFAKIRTVLAAGAGG